MTDHLFVYGTLKQANEPNFEFILNKLEYIGDGKIHGKMYDLGEYPGVIENNEKFVYGEIYRIQDQEMLFAIDDYEEVNRREPQKGLYVRKLVKAIFEDGKEIEVYAYFYNKSIKNAKEIPSGKWNKNR